MPQGIVSWQNSADMLRVGMEFVTLGTRFGGTRQVPVRYDSYLATFFGCQEACCSINCREQQQRRYRHPSVPPALPVTSECLLRRALQYRFLLQIQSATQHEVLSLIMRVQSERLLWQSCL